ncbi:hypothetical protein Glove_62g3 [Diversispora epigaea]|uniref:Uncharacterized protein n=1 Tax=Diversispora epigaea TaxID=1348612 RepID=A0A397JKK4_9GLOM|nr:hypothetical protein Glove_62g3 [Diversispora epigaea]
MGRIHKEYYSANARYLSNEAIREIKGSMGRVSNAINVMAKKYRINHYCVLDYIENRERKQQIIQSTISSEILPIPTILLEKSNQIESKVLHLESTTFPNKEIKKRSFKSNSKPRTKSIRISNPISNMVASTLSETEKINNEDLDALYEKEARRDEKNKANMTCLLAT